MDLLEPWRNAPPARYTLESDSEDEVDPEDYAGRADASTSASRSRSSYPSVELQAAGSKSDGAAALLKHGLKLLLVLDEAGMSWAEGLETESLEEAASLTLNEKKIASCSLAPDSRSYILFFAGSLTYEGMHAVSDEIYKQLNPSSITIIDSYSLPSYMSMTSSGSPLRCLATPDWSTSLDGAAHPYQPPNLVQGLSAAVASRASELALPCLILLFPSNLPTTGAASTASHTARRQLAPVEIYDYGGPSPYSDSSIDSSRNSQDSLTKLASLLGWEQVGWKLSTLTSKAGKQGGRSRSRSNAAAPKRESGFGWWKEERRIGEREIGEGGMYI